MAASPPTDARARPDRAKNAVLLLVSLMLAASALALVFFGIRRDWGFVAVFWSGVLAFIVVGWVVGLLKGGGVATADCPHCGASMSFMNIKSSRTQRCGGCGQWSSGSDAMRPIGIDHVAEMAVFRVPLPESEVHWPSDRGGTLRCPQCNRAATRSIELEATNVIGDMFAVLSPISLQRVHSLRVPACADHGDGAVLDLDEDGRGIVLLFRSQRYMQDFARLNVGSKPMNGLSPPDVATAQILSEFLRHNPRPLELRAPEVCPMHGVPALTAMGWAPTMHFLPSNQFMDDAAQNPMCLNVGEAFERPAKGKPEAARLVWCSACEVGMAELAERRRTGQND